jgi:hypothetical protein
MAQERPWLKLGKRAAFVKATLKRLTETDRNGFLHRYFDPPLTDEQRRVAT